MDLTALFQKRVLFVSGKGGVGKTSVSIMLALMAARAGKNTLIVEMNSSGRVAPRFYQKDRKHEEILLQPNIGLINLAPERCFEDYAINIIRFAGLFRSVFHSSYVSNFMEAVPGLDEFMMLNKVAELERQQKGKFSSRLKYDLLIVDAPATGHGLSALEVPGIIAAAIPVGPPHTQARRMLDLFGDRERTAFCLVTLAEEMPVAESEEYVSALKKRTNLGFGPLFINAVMPLPPGLENGHRLPTDLKVFLRYYALARERSELNRAYVEQIKARFPDFQKVVIPFHFRGLDAYPDFLPLAGMMKEVSP